MTASLINEILEEIGLESMSKSGITQSEEKSGKRQFEYSISGSPQSPVWRHDQKFLSRYHRNMLE